MVMLNYADNAGDLAIGHIGFRIRVMDGIGLLIGLGL